MYTNKLGDASSILSSILNAGEQIVRDITRPVYSDPRLSLPTTPPFLDPRTGQLTRPQTSDYTVPLLIGGGLLLLLLIRRGRK